MPILLPLKDREPYRQSLKTLTALHTEAERSLVTKKPLETHKIKLLTDMTSTDNFEGQIKALELGIDQITEEYEALLKSVAYEDLSAFAEYINLLEGPSKHHMFFCEKLMELEQTPRGRLIISSPPGSAKSTYCSRLLPAWYLGRHPRHTYMQAGHGQKFVDNELSYPTKAIVDSDRYRDIFPDVFLDPQKKATDMWRLNNPKGRYFGKGIGAGVSGFRCDFGSLDDPFASREDAETEGLRNKKFRWYVNDFSLRLLPHAPLLVVMTRWHTDDITGRLLEMQKSGDPNIDHYEMVNLAGLALENDPLGREEGEPLWPEFWNMGHYLNKKATLSASEWNSLYQGQPTDEQGGVFQADWIQRYRQLPTHEGRPPPPPDFEETHEQQAERLSSKDPDSIIVRTTLSVDTAIKASERANFTAITIWAESKSGKHFLVEVYRRRAEFNDMVNLIDKAARDHNVSAILVEDKGSGTQYIQTQQNKAFAPIIPISVQNQTKEFRFDSVTPMFVTGRVLLPHSGLWLPDYEKELLEFPASKYDDQVDSTSQYLSWAKPIARGGMKPLRGGV